MKARFSRLKSVFLLLLAVLSWQVQADAGIPQSKPSVFRELVPADAIERQAAQEYAKLKQQAAARNALAPEQHPQLRRLRSIAARMIPLTPDYNPRAAQWAWEINLIASNQINAFCMPGGKIAFFSSLLNELQLTNDEVAMVMGHEIAHALREHARAQMAKSGLTSLGADLLGQWLGQGKYAGLFRFGGDLLNLRFSRDDENDADLVGMELAARAGFDPRAGIILWQKMDAASRGAPPQWLSSHPSGKNRIREIEAQLPQVLPLYEQARIQQPR